MTTFFSLKIGIKSHTNRDFLVDDITDQIEHGNISEAEIIAIVKECAFLLRTESDAAVMESILNLFGVAFDRVGIQEDALHVVISLLDEFSSGCLVHAIPIIGCSALEYKRELIAPFLTSSNTAVRKITEQTLFT